MVCRNTARVHSRPCKARTALAAASLELAPATVNQPALWSVSYSRKNGINQAFCTQPGFRQGQWSRLVKVLRVPTRMAKGALTLIVRQRSLERIGIPVPPSATLGLCVADQPRLFDHSLSWVPTTGRRTRSLERAFPAADG